MQYGDVEGGEAFSTGHNVLLSPAVDIARVAQAGRAFEAFGEDPLLSGTMGAGVIRGIQQSPVVADIKHYNVYTQETNRLSGGNAVVEERALQEIYTRPFAIGIEQGRPGSAMCAFNKVNGVWACESDELLNQILKAQLDFQGWVMSDYGATHSTVPRRTRGLDQEMPGNTTPRSGPGPASSAARCSTPSGPARCRSRGSTTRSCASCGRCSRSGSSTTRRWSRRSPRPRTGRSRASSPSVRWSCSRTTAGRCR